MSAPDRFPRLTSMLLVGSRGRTPVRLDFLEWFRHDATLCYFIRDNRDEWLAYEDLPPQIIGLPPWAVTLLGGKIVADEAAMTLGLRRQDYAYNVENIAPHDPDRHLPPPENSIADEARVLDIDLVPRGADQKSLSTEALPAYRAKLSLLREVGTLGTPVADRDETLHARRTLFEAEERGRVEALIAERRERYAKEGESLAELYERATA